MRCEEGNKIISVALSKSCSIFILCVRLALWPWVEELEHRVRAATTPRYATLPKVMRILGGGVGVGRLLQEENKSSLGFYDWSMVGRVILGTLLAIRVRAGEGGGAANAANGQNWGGNKTGQRKRRNSRVGAPRKTTADRTSFTVHPSKRQRQTYCGILTPKQSVLMIKSVFKSCLWVKSCLSSFKFDVTLHPKFDHLQSDPTESLSPF